ncbi:polyribonucleotide nucleotidyltransferase [Pseudomonas sp. UL073]|uniref:Polyribonucleotide nucleotidyltransferase n=1 Tax=Zestomonas insulae TaxID=2809017 RepID=A0ABS2IEG8_9GAMM|nr:polyribonucleotide nucleotidyltransferase [Pseudomonas insulae]MBM7061435.1 polyribonucleotide nucleotidyltransferase [Pseudomonas insulae]
MRMQSRLIGSVVTVTLVTQLTACGTLFFPDRRGQIEGKIDPVVAALDAIGILFYVIPGLIAFGIDFATGAIYLPDGETAQVDPVDLQQTIGADGQVDKQQLKALIERETGRSLPLDDPRLLQQRGSLQQLASYGLQPAA